MTTEEIIAIRRAWDEGKPLQCDPGIGTWCDATIEPLDFSGWKWRIKPESSKPLEFWSNIYLHPDGREHRGGSYQSQAEAIANAGPERLRTVLFREVPELSQNAVDYLRESPGDWRLPRVRMVLAEIRPFFGLEKAPAGE